MNIEESGVAALGLSVTGTCDMRYTFTAQFLCGAAQFAKAAQALEDLDPQTVTEEDRTLHRAYVVSAIMQATAALETEIWDIIVYGPGHHLGSIGTDLEARDFLSPLRDTIDQQRTLTRYDVVLHLLRKPPLKHELQSYQSAVLLVKLRNELTHYKSKWGQEIEGQSLVKALRILKHPQPPFVAPGSSYFPHECLNAACATWAVRSSTVFMNDFYDRLRIASPLASYMPLLLPSKPVGKKRPSPTKQR